MEGGRVDQVHSGPPGTVLPWLETQQQEMAPGAEKVGGSGSGEEEEEEGEGGGVGDSEDEKPLEGTLDVCAPEAGGGPVCEDSGSGTAGGSKEHALVQEEEKEVGVVALSVYLAYWAAVGSLLAPAIFIALFLMQGRLLTLMMLSRS